MEKLTDYELLIEVKRMRTHLEPVLNSRSRDILKEIERRFTKLATKDSQFPANNRMTKEQILNKWLNKY